MTERFVAIGGDAAGMSAAGKAKRDDPDREVVVFERGDWVSYGACGIPYYVKGEVEHIDDLVVVEPRTFVEERGIDLRLHQTVASVDCEEQVVAVEGEDGRTELSYDDLLLATGGRAVLPDVPGADLDGVFAIRNLEAGRALRNYVVHDEPLTETASVPEIGAGHAAEFRSYLGETDPETVAVLGANKIGVELAEAFVSRGFEVHVFDDGEALPLFGPDVADVVTDHLREQGVGLHLGETVTRLRGGQSVTAVETDDDTVAVDAVVADLGVDPETELATDAGVELGETGAIATDEYGRTNEPNVYAAGDCAEKRHLLTGEAIRWPFALAANRAGRAVGRTVAGTPKRVGGIVGTSVMKAFDVEVARTGLDAPAAEAAGFDPVTTTITSITRAHYYPGWSRIVVHATADADSGRLLGASMVGAEGAAHRINSVAAALHAGMSVEEVGDLDFGYAPPFGPVWDPVLLAAKALGDEMEADGG